MNAKTIVSFQNCCTARIRTLTLSHSHTLTRVLAHTYTSGGGGLDCALFPNTFHSKPRNRPAPHTQFTLTSLSPPSPPSSFTPARSGASTRSPSCRAPGGRSNTVARCYPRADRLLEREKMRRERRFRKCHAQTNFFKYKY